LGLPLLEQNWIRLAALLAQDAARRMPALALAGIIALGDLTGLDLGFAPSRFGDKRAVKAKGQTPRAPSDSALHEIALAS
jgi:hypothetical protein